MGSIIIARYSKLTAQILRDSEHKFWKSVVRTPNKCWKWPRSLDKDGYGSFKNNNKISRAHRFSYELFYGKIPSTLVIDHLCRNKNCVNPDHLDLVTPRENILRGNTGHHTNQLRGKDHPHGKKTHCSNGHEYNKKNTYLRPKGGRNCRVCHKEVERVRRVIN